MKTWKCDPVGVIEQSQWMKYRVRGGGAEKSEREGQGPRLEGPHKKAQIYPEDRRHH